MTHPFEVRNEFTVDATPEEVWDAITTGVAVDSWLMGRSEIDSASKTTTFNMFGQVSTGSITVWEPGHRYATQEDENPDGTFTAFEWLIESRDGGGSVVRVVHSGLLGDDWEAEYNGLSVGDHAYMMKLAVYLEHFAPRTAKNSLFMPGPVTKDSWAAMTAAVGAARTRRTVSRPGSACPGSSRSTAPWSSWSRRASSACGPTTRCTC